jgi:hypothetical protein
MPLVFKEDKLGNNWVQWGNSRTHYYFKKDSLPGRARAITKCLRQAHAIEASKAKKLQIKKVQVFKFPKST